MKKKISSKKCIAVVLAVIMTITSIPFMMAGAEDGTDKYDPAPYFSDEAIKQGADAWIDEDGNVQVKYPSATPVKKFNGEDTTIAFYILELVDMGEKNAVHQKNVIDTIKVSGTSATFKSADIGEIDLENKRYSVTITAVDSENWFSQAMHVTVSEIPAITLTPEKFEGFSDSNTAVREIMTFESGTDDGTVTGGQLLYMGPTAETGTEDLTDNVGDTSALRFIMNTQPTTTQTFDTSYSRSTWDYKGATEMWYWMDLLEVELKGVSFRLRTNEKIWREWKDGTLETEQRVSEIVYSTKGTAAPTYTGEDPYVYVQREDGGWNKIMLNDDGTADIGNFKGYVRVPLKFMCSETATYVDISNQEIGQKKSFTSGVTNSVNEANAFAWMKSMTFSSKVLVDDAGTPISDALLIHRRVYKSSSGMFNAGDKHLFMWNIDGQTHLKGDTHENYDYSKIGYMLAMPLDPELAKTAVTTGNASTDRAYVSGTTVMNREAGLKAIEDIYNAGFSIEGCSADSLQHSFFVDNIFFYRTDNGEYTNNSLNDTPNTGEHMSVYYDETLEISRIIFDEIDKYIEDPDWADYREINYILDLIEAYRQIYASKGKDTEFLALDETDVDGDGICLAAAAAKLGRDSWANAWEAYKACLQEGTIGSANAGKNELVPVIVCAMEKLPAPENITSVSDALRSQIVRIWKAYSHLNLGQLEMLGKDEEKKVLQYVALLNGTSNEEDDFIVGQQLADYPFITYNDFENQELGAKGWKLEDNKDAYSVAYKSINGVSAGTHDPDNNIFTMANSWRHTKGLVSYTTNGSINITKEAAYGYSPIDGQDDEEIMDGKLNYNASSVRITDNGYHNSHAATMNIDSAFTADNQDGVFHTVTITRHGKDSANWAEFQNNKLGLDNLGYFSTENSNGTESIGLSLIFYVDFTELENFYFTTNIYTSDENGTPIKARVNMGSAELGNISDPEAYKREHWKYFILNPNTGAWVLNHTTSQWCFTSSPNTEWGDEMLNGLNGYKGYLMVPLYHVKVQESIVNEKKLDGSSTWLNNIYAIQFCIGGANGASLDEKSFTIDNVGFTYDPAGYATHTYKSYAETFGAKSLPAKQFEDRVAAIDLYSPLFSGDVTVAENLYNALNPYQQTMVADAYAVLEEYKLYRDGVKTVEPAEYTPTDIATFVQTLPDTIKDASVTGAYTEIVDGNEVVKSYDIPYPGFSSGAVNYAAMGITYEQALEIIKYYETGYNRFSKQQKTEIMDQTVRTQFLNAYNMAMRLTTTLEKIKKDAVEFLPEITTLYTVKYDYDNDGKLENKDENIADETSKIGNFLSITNRDAVKTFYENEYCSLQYYSKTSIDDGSIYSQLQNTSRGFTYFLNNTKEFTVDGEPIQGGILTLRDKMDNIYKMANDHLTNQTLFTDEEIQSVKDVINEYNALLPAYYNVEELYELAQQIIRLFPRFDVAMGTTDLILSPDSASQQTTYSVNYAEYLDLGTDTTKMYIRLSTESADGTMSDALGNKISYKLKMGEFEVNASEINSLTDDAWMGTYPVTNNTYTPTSAANFVITASVTEEQISSASLLGAASDKVILEFVTSDGTVIDTRTINVSYSESVTYEITFPAAVTVPFGETNAVTSGDITTTHNMPSTKKLTISLSETGGTMVIDTTKLLTGVTVPDPLPSIDYTATFADKIITGIGTTGTDKTNFTVQVAQDQWNQAYVNDYIDSGLTFTVACEDVT